MANDFESRVLRIGVIQQGRIVEERLLRKAGPVTVGTSAKCTIILPGTSGPESSRMFEVQGQEYVLQFEDSMQGRVSLGNRVVDLATLRAENLAKKAGQVWSLPLVPGSRGRLVFGDTTLLFQFVTRPEPARPAMPASLKQHWTRRIDMPLLAILTLSFVVQSGLAGGLHVWWEKTGQYLERPRRRTEILRPLVLEFEQRKKKPEEEAKPEPEQPVLPKEVVEVPKPEPVPEPKREEVAKKPEDLPPDAVVPDLTQQPKSRVEGLSADQYAKARDKVKMNTILRHLGSEGPGVDGSFENTLSSGVTEKEMADAFDTSGVRIAEAGDTSEFRGKPKRVDEGRAFTTVAKSDIAKPQVKTVETAVKEESDVKVNVSAGTLGAPVGTGKLDSNKVKGVFQKRKSAIRSCYEDALRQKPDAEGKVKIRFTIGPAGRITEITVVENTTGSGALADCVVRKVQGWRFDKPDNGSVTYTYPFILSKSD